jgi:hypothetical protein
MRWHSKHTEIEIKDAATRLERVFAWMPTRISNEIVWLETYEILQMFHVKQYNITIDNKPVFFKVGEWVNISKRIIQ